MASIVEQIDALEPGQIRVYRDSDRDIGFREAVLYLDGENIGSVDYKKVFERSVKPGPHTIRAFNRVFNSKTLEFEVQPGERVTFQVANVGGFFFKVFMLLCMGIPRIRLTKENNEDVAPSRRTASRHST